MLTITTPISARELDEVRSLFRAFIAWHRGRHQQDLHLIDRYFDAAAFESELAGLPGGYAPPDGGLFLASVDGAAVGCVALRRIDSSRCEMKRMFVRPESHGRGAGRGLATRVISHARELGYERMLLDTSFRQKEAMSLYRSMGFRDVPPYYQLPEEVRDWLVFMELALQ